MLRPAATAGYLALCVSATICAEQASAAEWRVSPSAYVGTSYSDNPRLQTENEISSAGAVSEFSASMKRLTERSEFSLTPRLRSARYSDDESLDSDDKFITTGYRWFSERSEWSSEFGFTRDTTLTSELGLTGLVQSNRPHRAITLSAGPTFMLSERVSVGGQLYSTDNHYSDIEFTGLVDYAYRALSLFSSYAMSDRSSFTVTAQGGQLSSEGFGIGIGPVTRDGSLKVSWSYRPYDLWQTTLSAGPSYVDSATGVDTGAIFEVAARRRGELWSMSTLAGRSLTPTGRGILMRRDRLSLNFNRSLSERLSASVGAQWVRSEDLVTQANVDTYYTEYARVDLTGYWRLAEHWSLALQLTGTSQGFELATERAEGYRALLSMVWNGLPLSL